MKPWNNSKIARIWKQRRRPYGWWWGRWRYLFKLSVRDITWKNYKEKVLSFIFFTWIELNWITLFKVSYVILKLHNSSHLLKVCLNNANRPKIIMTITIKIKKIRILKRALYVTGLIFLHNDIVILILLGQCMSYTACRGMPLVSTT